MPQKNLVIWGMGGHSLVVADILRRKQYGFIKFIEGGPDQLDSIHWEPDLIVAIGDCRARMELARVARQKGFKMVSAIHPGAIVASDAEVGSGSVIAAGAVVNSGAKIGQDVIVNTCASVDHECIVEDGAHICPGAHLAGCVRVGRGTQIGIGATVIERINIGAGSLIGAGSVVVRDIPDNAVAYGVPARVLR